MRNTFIKFMLALVLLMPVVGMNGCCSSYSYEKYWAQAEKELKNKKFKKARSLYSVIYAKETEKKTPVFEHVAWTFYRLGVIAEMQNDVTMAIGYYWGDSMDEDYYVSLSKLNWLARTGWKHLDEGGAPRTLEEILALEEQDAPEVTVKETKKAEIVPKASYSYRNKRPAAKSNQPRATYNRSMTPPPYGSEGPFQVFH